MSEQDPPKPNDSTPIVDQLVDYYKDRKRLGIDHYGVPLQAGNGRDALRDAFEEAVDLSIYLAQVIIERDGRLP